MSMRVEWMLTTVILRLQAIDLMAFEQGTASAMMRVPGLGPARVEDQHRDVLLDGRQHGGRVQHLGAEVGQLGGFGEGDAFHAVAAGDDARVGGQHAVHVGPDLDLLGADARAHDGRAEVRAAAARAWS